MIIEESRHEFTYKDDKTIEEYTIGRYDITYIQHKNQDGNVWWDEVSVRKKAKSNKYLPIIYSVEAVEVFSKSSNETQSFTIETASYGELPVSEIDKLIEALNEARYVADVLNKRYAKGE